jgi:hypothetical protein
MLKDNECPIYEYGPADRAGYGAPVELCGSLSGIMLPFGGEATMDLVKFRFFCG